MDDIEIKNALNIPLTEEEEQKKIYKELFEEALMSMDWKKQFRDWYMWEFEYKPMFARIEFPKKELDIGK